jgi:hypothetical protein
VVTPMLLTEGAGRGWPSASIVHRCSVFCSPARQVPIIGGCRRPSHPTERYPMAGPQCPGLWILGGSKRVRRGGNHGQDSVGQPFGVCGGATRGSLDPGAKKPQLPVKADRYGTGGPARGWRLLEGAFRWCYNRLRPRITAGPAQFLSVLPRYPRGVRQTQATRIVPKGCTGVGLRAGPACRVDGETTGSAPGKPRNVPSGARNVRTFYGSGSESHGSGQPGGPEV